MKDCLVFTVDHHAGLGRLAGDVSLLVTIENAGPHPAETRRDGVKGCACWVFPATMQKTRLKAYLQGTNPAGQAALESFK